MVYIVNDKIINGKDIKSSFYLFYLIPFIVPLSLILLPLHLESLMHKNPQRRKTIHGMPSCRMQTSIDWSEHVLL